VKTRYSLEDFAHVPAARKIVSTDMVLGTLPSVDEVKALAKWTPEILEKFGRGADYFSGFPKKDRSAAMSELAHLGLSLDGQMSKLVRFCMTLMTVGVNTKLGVTENVV